MNTRLAFMRRALSAAAAGIVITSFASGAVADTYRWVDDAGIVNYSERKPRGVPVERIQVISSGSTRRARADDFDEPAAAPAPVNRSVSYSESTGLTGDVDRTDLNEDQLAMLDDLEQMEAERQAQVARIRADNCARSRRVLNNLQTMGRIRVTDEDGTNRVMPEDERARRISEAQQGVAANCDA